MDTDTQIKKLFQIGAGVRTKEEDEKLLESVRAHVLDEIVEFIKDSLGGADRRAFLKEIGSFGQGEEKLSELFVKYLDKIPDSKTRLAYRINSFLINLYLSSSSDK